MRSLDIVIVSLLTEGTVFLNFKHWSKRNIVRLIKYYIGKALRKRNVVSFYTIKSAARGLFREIGFKEIRITGGNFFRDVTFHLEAYKGKNLMNNPRK